MSISVDTLRQYFSFPTRKKMNIVFQVSLTFRIRWLIITASTMLQVAQISVYLLLKRLSEYEESLEILIIAV